TETAEGISPHRGDGSHALRPVVADFPRQLISWLAPIAVAASIAIGMTFAERTTGSRAAGPAWSVATLAGAPRVGTETAQQEARFRVGQWLEPASARRAKLANDSVGQVTVDPNSRLRLAAMADKDQRLELARGSMSAFIWAPPRLFFVDTPSATAV